MEKGWLPTSTDIHWVKEPQHTIWGGIIISTARGLVYPGKMVPKSSVSKGIMRNLEAHICQQCKKIVLNYE